jgi:hypothetical protein
MPSHFIQRRRSASHVHVAMEIVSNMMDPAIARWLHSYRIPPRKGGTLKDPKEVGQSGMERPASLLVTSAPAMMRTKVAHAVKTAKRWCARLYGVVRDFRSNSSIVAPPEQPAR